MNWSRAATASSTSSSRALSCSLGLSGSRGSRASSGIIIIGSDDSVCPSGSGSVGFSSMGSSGLLGSGALGKSAATFGAAI